MRHIIVLSWLACIYATGVAAQQIEQARIRKYVVAPRSAVLQVVAVQPNCPIQFEDVQYLVFLEGGGSNSYRVRNVGTKPIRSVNVASSNGAGNIYFNNGNVLAMPGDLLPEESPICRDCVRDERIPLTDELREKLNLNGPMRLIMVLMVVEVEFMDGTKYTDKATYETMQTYLDKIGDALEEQKQRRIKQP